MSRLVVMGAVLECSMGASPSLLIVLPKAVYAQTPAADITCYAPLVNIMTFGVCSVTGIACVPVTATPWTPGSSAVTQMGIPLVSEDSILMCSLGGVISVTSPGQTAVDIA